MEAPKGREWGWYSPQQIPSLTAWLETGTQQEQQLAEDLYAVYLPVLNIVKQPGQVSPYIPVSGMQHTHTCGLHAVQAQANYFICLDCKTNGDSIAS